ncbi:MAG TPA: aminoglycoside phosphotransferase family protein, partial [Ignavibacteria bacterium]
IVYLNEQTYLLRTFDIKYFNTKKNEYDALLKMKELDVKCSRPLDLGNIKNHQIGYMLLSYIEGNAAEEELPLYSEEEQYSIGLEAGRELSKMHQYKTPPLIPSYYVRKTAKHKFNMNEYYDTEVKVKDDHKIISFIEENIGLIKGRPDVFQHDDFHVGNIIVSNKKLSGIIDFNRIDWGDPVHEFMKTGFFSAAVSVPFSIGQVRGYYNHVEPDVNFWKLYSLYVAMCVFASVVWIRRTRPEETGQMIEKIYKVLDDHDYFEQIIPKWYENS